jgi:hypothetical protein
VTTVTARPLESSAKTKQILGSDGDVGSVFHARSVAGKYQLLLVYRRGWVFVLPVLYYLGRHRPWMIPVDAAVKAPTGYAEFPREMLRPPRSLAKKMFVDIQRWTVMKKGGHSAAMETKALADDIQAFFRPLRK